MHALHMAACAISQDIIFILLTICFSEVTSYTSHVFSHFFASEWQCVAPRKSWPCYQTVDCMVVFEKTSQCTVVLVSRGKFCIISRQNVLL